VTTARHRTRFNKKKNDARATRRKGRALGWPGHEKERAAKTQCNEKKKNENNSHEKKVGQPIFARKKQIVAQAARIGCTKVPRNTKQTSSEYQ